MKWNPSIVKSLINYLSQGGKSLPGTLNKLGLYWVAILFVGVSTLWGSNELVLAQEKDILLLQPPNTENFPVISLEFKVDQGLTASLPEFQSSEFSVIENGQRVPILGLEKVNRGVYFTLAINAGRELDLRDAQRISPYMKMTAALADWAGSRGASPEDAYSLVTPERVSVRHTRDTGVWVDALAGYQPEFRQLKPSLASLELAIQQASERVVPFGVAKALLYITPPPAPDQIAPIKALADKAEKENLQITVWYVGDAHYLSNDQGEALVALAEKTGGQFYHVTGTDDLPDLADYLNEMGTTYTLTYDSQIKKTGTYPLRVEINTPDGQLSGESAPFFITVKPPNPVLISPPAVITRQKVTVTGDGADAFEPSDYLVKFLLDFPDDHPRKVVVSRLYIDGIIVDMQDAPPFDALNWDLTSITEPGEHTIQVEVVDSIGLSARTINTPVRIEVRLPESDPYPFGGRNAWAAAGLTAGIALIALVVWSAPQWMRRKRQQAGQAESLSDSDSGEGADFPTENLPRENFALLHPLEGSWDGGQLADLPIDHSPAIIGRDSSRVTLRVAISGVSGLQARLWRHERSFWLADLGSEKGTYLNFKPCGTQPVELHQGDMIHFGDVGFRFTINDQQKASKISISKYEPLI